MNECSIYLFGDGPLLPRLLIVELDDVVLRYLHAAVHHRHCRYAPGGAQAAAWAAVRLGGGFVHY